MVDGILFRAAAETLRTIAADPTHLGAEIGVVAVRHTRGFSMRVDDGGITSVRFHTSACVTLVAYCEVAAQRVTGRTLADAARCLTPPDLALALPLVPAVKRDRARLAAQALVATIVDVAKDAHA